MRHGWALATGKNSNPLLFCCDFTARGYRTICRWDVPARSRALPLADFEAEPSGAGPVGCGARHLDVDTAILALDLVAALRAGDALDGLLLERVRNHVIAEGGMDNLGVVPISAQGGRGRRGGDCENSGGGE